MIIPDEDLENSIELSVSSPVVTGGKNNTVSILAIKLNDHALTFTKKIRVAVFQFLSRQDENELIVVGPETLALNKMRDGDGLHEMKKLLRVGKTKRGREPKRPPPEYDNIWFPTPDICQNPGNLPPLQRTVFDNIVEIQKRDLLDPQNNEHDKKTFLAQFD